MVAEKSKEKLKAFLLFSFFALFLILIIFNLYRLQIKEGNYYQAIALGQRMRLKEISGERGGIFFNGGKISLAENKAIGNFLLFAKKINSEERNELVQWFKKIGFNKEDIDYIFSRKISRGEIKADEVIKAPPKIKAIKNFQLIKGRKRIYPQKEIAGHIVGFTNDDGIGQYGLEGYYNGILKGKEYLLQKGVSPFGYLTNFSQDNSGGKKNLKGADLILTIDYNIQYLANKLMEKAAEEWGIDSGQIIIEDPLSGKILAMVNYPEYDPNNYKKIKDFSKFINPSIQELFEPGSIFKPLVMAAAIEEGIIEPTTTYIDKGYVDLGGRPITNFEKKVWGKRTMTEVLEHSINTGAVFAEQKLGAKKFLNYLAKFGLFKKTGIDLQGEEYSENKRLKNGYPRDIAVASFGQGIEVTPIQVVEAFSAIANGGKLMKPYVVEKIINEKGKSIRSLPKIIGYPISPLTSAKVTAMMVSVVKNGSGRRARISGYDIAGKTGTAQVALPNKRGYFENKTIQTFVAFFPAIKPRALILVKFDNPKHSIAAAVSTAPTVKAIIRYLINYWQIPPGRY